MASLAPTPTPTARLRLPSLLEVGALVAFLFVVAPIVVVAGAALNSEAMAFPPRHLTLHWMIQALQDADFVQGAIVSFCLAAAAATVATAFAIPVALMLRRIRPAAARLLSLTFLGPLLVPTIIFALALYQVMLTLFGSNSLFALLAGHIIITMPYPVRTITAVSENLDPALEDAASSVGSDPWNTFRRVTLPLIKSGMIAGFLFAFITSWNDFSVSIFLTPRAFAPLPIKIYEYLLYEYRPLVAAVSTWSVLASAVLVYMIDRLVGLNVFVGQRAS